MVKDIRFISVRKCLNKGKQSFNGQRSGPFQGQAKVRTERGEDVEQDTDE